MSGSQKSWGIVGSTASALFVAALVGDMMHAPGRGNYSLWVSPLGIAAYTAIAVLFGCIVCGVRDVPFPFHREGHRGGWVVLASSPDNLRGEDIGNGFQRVRLRDLFGEYRTHTTADAQLLLQRYYGKWIRVVGKIYDEIDDLPGSNPEGIT